jgi:CdiI immunity protein
MDNDIFKTFPYLAQFMGGYFYQSALEYSDSEEAIFDEFFSIEDGAPWYNLGLWCDIKRIIDLHPQNLLANFDELIEPDYIIGNNDAQAKEWLVALANRCEAHLQRRANRGTLFAGPSG